MEFRKHAHPVCEPNYGKDEKIVVFNCHAVDGRRHGRKQPHTF